MNEQKTRTITLTGRPPVKIKENEWPVIATVSDDSYGSVDLQRHQQAVLQGEVDKYLLRVRQHADGRTIVYGVLDAATSWTHTEDWRGGELLIANSDIAAAIERIGQDGGIPDEVIRNCVADLPAEEI